MENVLQYIKPELLVLIPVLYFVGVALKQSQAVKNNKIPLILGGVGVVLASVYVLSAGVENPAAAVFMGITQGILCAGCSVYVNQIYKQGGKGE